MSSNARRRAHPDSHLIERHIARNPARAWHGHVCIHTERGVLEVPGMWHLDVPGAARPMLHDARAALPLPASGEREAWRDHLARLVTLQVPGMQLRVRTADAAGWQSLEFAAPTSPASVVQVDREGLVALLGTGAGISLSIHSAP